MSRSSSRYPVPSSPRKTCETRRPAMLLPIVGFILAKPSRIKNLPCPDAGLLVSFVSRAGRVAGARSGFVDPTHRGPPECPECPVPYSTYV
ncbi:hypothetical protein N656DRAFT_773146 [Canariomyces notabilis]|uniref:Uncharacterized protein n=1 Tax=Canariomyces notabilis TaxID=2074819 RepID=A0AAN6TMG1_9PEZI|nr:hypothetical protein N656DRAFT_773146 [Canariomyces arenarius]